MQSQLQSLLAHIMQCFQLLKSTTNYFDKIMENSFGKNQTQTKGLPFIVRNKVCMRKNKGGLVLSKEDDANKVVQLMHASLESTKK